MSKFEVEAEGYEEPLNRRPIEYCSYCGGLLEGNVTEGAFYYYCEKCDITYEVVDGDGNGLTITVNRGERL